MTRLSTLDEAFAGPVGRPRERTERARTVSFKAPESITTVARERQHPRGLLTRYLTACLILFCERPTHEFEDFISQFEANRGGLAVERMTAKDLLTHARKAGLHTVTRPRRLRPIARRGRSGVLTVGPQTD